jgi:hypothetical protein
MAWRNQRQHRRKLSGESQLIWRKPKMGSKWRLKINEISARGENGGVAAEMKKRRNESAIGVEASEMCNRQWRKAGNRHQPVGKEKHHHQAKRRKRIEGSVEKLAA